MTINEDEKENEEEYEEENKVFQSNNDDVQIIHDVIFDEYLKMM